MTKNQTQNTSAAKSKRGTKLRISSEHLDVMMDRIIHNGCPIANWYPSMEFAKWAAKEPVKNYEFFIWVLYSNEEMELNNEQKNVETYLNNVLKETTQIVA